jgi:hypothetical protein
VLCVSLLSKSRASFSHTNGDVQRSGLTNARRRGGSRSLLSRDECRGASQELGEELGKELVGTLNSLYNLASVLEESWRVCHILL